MIGVGDLFEQLFGVLARADDGRVAIADGAMEQPCANSIHFLDVADVDRHRIAHRVDFALSRGGARDRQRPQAAIYVAVVMFASGCGLPHVAG